MMIKLASFLHIDQLFFVFVAMVTVYNGRQILILVIHFVCCSIMFIFVH